MAGHSVTLRDTVDELPRSTPLADNDLTAIRVSRGINAQVGWRTLDEVIKTRAHGAHCGYRAGHGSHHLGKQH